MRIRCLRIRSRACRRYPVRAHAGLALLIFGVLFPLNVRAMNVLTWHNDVAHTGQNLWETILTPGNVNSYSFGQWFSYEVDGFVYAQPLYFSHVTVPGKGVRNLVFVATEHDSVYAFDADDPQRDDYGPVWKTSFIDPSHGVTTVPLGDLGFQGAEIPELGITGTPVIDATTGTLYVAAQTRAVDSAGNFSHPQWLHALDVATGAEKFGGPARIQASVSGFGTSADNNGNVVFDETFDFQRPGLLLSKGIVYVGYASVGDSGPYHGWLLGFDAHTLALTQVFNDTPNGAQGGIWMSGSSPAADADGNVYCTTGNGDFDPTVANYGDTFLKLTPSGTNLVVADYFTPWDQLFLNVSDTDLGSGGPLLLPDSVANPAHPHLLIGCGKEGTIYLVDRDNMGHFNTNDDTQIVQSLPQILTSTLGTPAFFNGWIYYQGVSDALKAFSISNGVLSTAPVSQNSQSVWNFPGGTPSISADGTNNAIAWLLQTDTFYQNAPAILHAYNATNLEDELYNSNQAATRDHPGMAQKFAVPVVADGKVFVQGASRLTVYGNLQAPVIVSQPAGVVAAPSASVQLSVTAVGPPPLIYQWSLAGKAIEDATNATFTATGLKLGQSGPYTVEVTSPYGAVVSAEANVVITSSLTLTLDADQQLLLVGPSGTTCEIQFLDEFRPGAAWQRLLQLSLPDGSPEELAQASFVDSSPRGPSRYYRAKVLLPNP